MKDGGPLWFPPNRKLLPWQFFNCKMIFLFIDFSCFMVLHRGAQKFLVKNLYFWPNGLIFGSKRPKFGQNQQFSAKMAFFQGPWIFFSRVFCKNDFGYLFSIPLRTCVPSFIFLGHSGAILIGGAIMPPPPWLPRNLICHSK